jgi:hypothetical protein
MVLTGKLQTLKGLPADTVLLFTKAVFISAAVRFTLLFLSFSRVMNWLGNAGKETPQHNSGIDEHYVQKVKTAVWLCNKYTPWKTECYVQALTARLLLRQKQVPSTIYIGFRKRAGGKFEGHAWLRSGELIVTGNKDHATFQVHSLFS